MNGMVHTNNRGKSVVIGIDFHRKISKIRLGIIAAAEEAVGSLVGMSVFQETGQRNEVYLGNGYENGENTDRRWDL